MPIITIGGGKGGTGKSTIAFNLAWCCRENDLKVVLVDTDPQLSSFEMANSAGEELNPLLALAAGDAVRPQIIELAESYDLVIVDTQGRQSRRATQAMGASDVVLFPCKPSPLDVKALRPSLEMFQIIVDQGIEVEGYLLVNEADGTVISRDATAALAAEELPLLKTAIPRSVDFKEAAAFGIGVTEYGPNKAAAKAIHALTFEVFEILETMAERRGAIGAAE